MCEEHYTRCFERILGVFATFQKGAISFVMPVRLSFRPSVRPSVRFSPDGFSWSLVFEYFSKICRENSSFI